MSIKYTRNRNLSIDLIKIVAMILVVGLHSMYIFVDGTWWNFGNIVYKTGVIAIPLFFMVSGYLILGRHKKVNDVKYAMYKIWGIFRFTLFMSIFFAIGLSFKIEMGNWLLTIINNWGGVIIGSFLQKRSLWMLWYLGAMIIIYVLYPIINKIFISKQSLFRKITICIGLVAVLSFLCNILNLPLGKPFEFHVIQTFRLWDWLFYFCMGGIMHEVKIRRVSKSIIWFLVIMLGMVNLYQQTLLVPLIGMPQCEYFYGSPITMIFVVIFFIACNNLKIGNSVVISLLSTVFLPVYLIHCFIINMFFRMGIINLILETNSIFSPLIIWMLVTTVSIVTSLILIKIPYLNNILKL